MTRRSYAQWCAIAESLDLLGERWTLLVIRELLIGPRRFSDLLGSLPGIGTGLLAERLKLLESETVIRRRVLPPPAGSTVYELTDSGRELKPVLVALARWGARWRLEIPTDAQSFSPDWVVLAAEALVDHDAVAGLTATYQIEIDDQPFTLAIDAGAVHALSGAAPVADATLRMSRETLIDLAAGQTTVEAALVEGRLVADGDEGALARLADALPLPVVQRR